MAEDWKGLAAVTVLDAIAERVSRGEPLQPADAAELLGTPDLITVSALADEVRRRMHGEATTFVRVFDMHVDAVPASAPAAIAAGEFRVIGVPASADAAAAAVAAPRRLAGSTPLTGFSLADVAALARSNPDVFARLAEAGLDAIAGTPIDRPEVSAASVEAARAAGLLVQCLTVEGPADGPLPLITAAVELQRTAGGFRAFAPLSRSVRASAPTTGYDDLKCVALARLLARDVPSIQVDWRAYGPKLAQVALTAGADDVDDVAAGEDPALGRRRGVLEEIRRNILAAGLQPVERNGRYEILPDARGQLRPATGGS